MDFGLAFFSKHMDNEGGDNALLRGFFLHWRTLDSSFNTGRHC